MRTQSARLQFGDPVGVEARLRQALEQFGGELCPFFGRKAESVLEQLARLVRHGRSIALVTASGKPAWPCPCCGYLVFTEPPGSSDSCPFCFWEDDLVQLLCATSSGGANRVSLHQAQQNFALFGAKEDRSRQHVVPPPAGQPRDVGWRPIDEAKDRFPGFEDAAGPKELGENLYYWRPTYWRLQQS